MRRQMLFTFAVLAAIVLLSGLRAQAQQLADYTEPGSVLVFPKFVRGTVAAGVPATEIEISVHCPLAIQPCAVPGTNVRLMMHWVCPGQFETQICKETNFVVNTTVEGTIWFNTEGPGVGFANVKVPAAPCPEGFLVAWVVNSANRAIKFDGLVGDADLRWNNHAEASYKAIPVQAATAIATNGFLDVNNDGEIQFDGSELAFLTGTVMGTVKYDTTAAAADAPVTTSLTLLTLDIDSNRGNNSVFTDIDFYDASENVLSESLSFVCWTEIPLSSIDANLTREFMGRKGFFVSLDAAKVAQETADETGPVTLFGLIDTVECPGTTASCVPVVPVTAANNPGPVNHIARRTDDDSVPVPGEYEPNDKSYGPFLLPD